MTTVPRNRITKVTANPEPTNTETNELIFHLKNDMRRKQNLDPEVASTLD